MTTPTMTEIEKNTTVSRRVQNLNSILLSSGWHKVSNPEKIEFSVSASPVTDGPYTYLKYTSQDGETCYTPFSQIQSFKFNEEN